MLRMNANRKRQSELQLKKRISSKCKSLPSIHIQSIFSNRNPTNPKSPTKPIPRLNLNLAKQPRSQPQPNPHTQPLLQPLNQNPLQQTNFTLFLTNFNSNPHPNLPSQPLPQTFTLIKIPPKPQPQQSLQKPNNSNSNYNYDDINFSILSYTNNQLIQVSVEIMGKFGLADVCGKVMLVRVVREIFCGYRPVAYHNFSHGFSVMHMMYQLLRMDSKFRELYTKQQIGFALLAALAHDLNHNGTNNAFQNKLNTQLSKTANKQSVLQKMHIKTLLTLLKSKNIPILDKTKNSTKMKQLMVRLILATDVARHFHGVERIRGFRERQGQGQGKGEGEGVGKGRGAGEQLDFGLDQHRYFLMEQAFHACDIGNPCLGYDEYMNWAALLSFEFHHQTTLETLHGVEVSQILRYKGLKQFYQGQIGFINIMVLPLWKQLTILWPGFQKFMKNMEQNLGKLKEEVNRLGLEKQG